MRAIFAFLAALAVASPAWALTPAQRVVLFSGGGGIYTVVSSNINAADEAGSGPSTVTVTLPKVVAGDTVFIEGGYCQRNNACTGNLDDFGSGTASGSAGLGTCVKSSSQNTSANPVIDFQFACPVTSSASNITITVSNNTNPMYFVQVSTQDVHSAIGWSGTPDQSLGKNTYYSAATAVPSVSSGTPVPAPSFAIASAFFGCGSSSIGSGWALLNGGGSTGTNTILAEYEIPSSAGAVAATMNNPGSCGLVNIQVDVYK